MILFLLLGQLPTSHQIVENFRQKIAKASAVRVTVTYLHEEFPKPFEVKFWYRKGGYYRTESKQGTLIASPSKCWSYKPTGKTYREFPGAQRDWSIVAATGLGEFDPAFMPTIGRPELVKWHGLTTIRVELDGRKQMTKETKLYCFYDAKTLDQVGISANLGSITQVRIFRDLKIDPKIDEKMFRFSPPKGWKLVKGAPRP